MRNVWDRFIARNLANDNDRDGSNGHGYGAEGARIETPKKEFIELEKVVGKDRRTDRIDTPLASKEALPKRKATKAKIESTPKQKETETGVKKTEKSSICSSSYFISNDNTSTDTHSDTHRVPETPDRVLNYVEETPRPSSRRQIKKEIVIVPETSSESTSTGTPSYIPSSPNREQKVRKYRSVKKTGNEPEPEPEKKPEKIDDTEEISTMDKLLGNLAKDISDSFLKKKATKA